jgi:hypothetical protein
MFYERARKKHKSDVRLLTLTGWINDIFEKNFLRPYLFYVISHGNHSQNKKEYRSKPDSYIPSNFLWHIRCRIPSQ